MQYVWRCQKCFRYLSHIENNSETNPITQRTICPRCKSENRITLTLETVIASCAFSRKYDSNLTKTKLKEAPSTKTLLIEKVGKETCISTKIIIKGNKKDS